MIDSDTKKFINEIVIGFADELRLILTEYSGFIERMNEKQCEALGDIALSIESIEERLCEISQSMENE